MCHVVFADAVSLVCVQIRKVAITGVSLEWATSLGEQLGAPGTAAFEALFRNNDLSVKLAPPNLTNGS